MRDIYYLSEIFLLILECYSCFNIKKNTINNLTRETCHIRIKLKSPFYHPSYSSNERDLRMFARNNIVDSTGYHFTDDAL